MSRALRITGWVLMALLATLVSVVSWRYFALNPGVFFPEQVDEYLSHKVRLLTHVAGGTTALLIGPWLFWGAFRNKYLGLHRWLGRLYLVASVGFGGVGGLFLAFGVYGGLCARLGFAMLSILWIAFGIRGYLHIRQRDIKSHRAWMIRSYALTFAAVTLRLWNPLLVSVGVEFIDAYRVVAWLCWVPNLVLVEVHIRRRPSLRAA